MTANPTPLSPEGVAQADRAFVMRWQKFLKHRYDQKLMDAGRYDLDPIVLTAAHHRIAATSAAEGEAYNRGVNDGVTEIEKTLHRILRTEWKPSNFQDPTAPTVMQMIDIFEARATKAEAANARLMEAVANLLPTKLCGESWNLPDGESVTIVATFGKLAALRQALDQGAEG